MGKLAVPEYILNKPGKLTEAEFQKMKLHASVGADILSAIDFPYPVVPIVRHHHENWDGTGYPSGIKATEIPIGARILAVVDCFDALTSDRPYRAKLSDDEALAILKQRSGSMYDPMVVDAFFRFHSVPSPELPRQGPPSEVLNTIADVYDWPDFMPPPKVVVPIPAEELYKYEGEYKIVSVSGDCALSVETTIEPVRSGSASRTMAIWKARPEARSSASPPVAVVTST